MNELPLGLRFYDSLEKQKRWHYTCAKGIRHNEYQYADTCDLPPFQIMRTSIPTADCDIYVLCADTGDELFQMSVDCPALLADIQIATVGSYDYVTYPGGHACCNFNVTLKTLVYLRYEDTDNTLYSELFWIEPKAEGDLDTYYRVWLGNNRRSSDPDDLRIYR